MAFDWRTLVVAMLVAGTMADHLSDFMLRSHRSISGHSVQSYCGVDPEYCARHCKIDREYNCRSFNYNTGSRCCYMNDENSATATVDYTRTVGTDYYELKAGRALDLYTYVADSRLNGVANIIKCGLRAEDCAQWCMKEAAFTCMSFDYDKEFGCCYLSEETRQTAPTNFVSSFSHDYYEFKSGAATGYFEHSPGHSLTNNNDLILCDVQQEECALRCLQETSFHCKSFDYVHAWRCCYLSSEDRTTQVSSYQMTSGQDYYQYLPGNRWRDDGHCGSSWSADLARPAECDPYGNYCCVGSTCQQGTCTSGTDYRGWDRCGERMCSCSSASRTMTCSGRRVQHIDFFIPRNTRNLDLSSNLLTSVPVSALDGLTELQTLNLRTNRMSSLPFDVLQDLISAQTINLQGNHFHDLDLGQFMDLPALRNLYVDSSTSLKFNWGYLPEVYPSHGVSCPFNDCYNPCGDPHYLNGPQDWSRLQTDLVIKQLYFDLADLFYYVGGSTRSVTIYAHTVVASVGISFNFDLTINTQMFWTNTNADLSFTLPGGHHSGPMITCGMLDDSFRQININVGNKLKVNIVTNESFVMPYPCSESRSSALALRSDPDQMAVTLQCARLIAQDFNLADPRSQPMRMVDWVISQGRAAGQPVYSEAVTIKYELMVSATGARYVPYMSKSVYLSMLDDYYRETNVFRDEYNRALDRTESVELRLEAARRLMAKQNDIIQLQERDLEDMRTELQVARETRLKMKAKLDESTTKLDAAKVTFEAGIERYKDEQAAKAAFGFIGAVFGIFVGAIQIALGDVVGGVSGIVGNTIDIFSTLNDLTILIRDLEEYNSIADDALDSSASTISSAEYEGFMLTMERVVELHVKLVEWDNLQNVASALLGHGEVTKIRGSRDYRKVMSETANWGKALTETTIAEAELRVQYESRKRWLAAEVREKERIEAQIGLDESRREISLELTSAIGLTAFHVKLELNNILLDYCNSYYYFQFQECGSTYKPNLSDDLVTLLTKVSNANRDGLQNLVSFNPPPQPFNNLIIRIMDLPTACVNATECPVSTMKETQILNMEIRPDHPNFLSWDRVRIEKIRIFLIGAHLPSNRMRVSISTSGEFFDRYRSIEQDFVGVPLSRGFEYNPSTNGVIVDGTIHDDFNGYYSLTTPFTTWMIDVSSGLNSGLDLSELSRVEMHMWGSLVSGARGGDVIDNMVIDL